MNSRQPIVWAAACALAVLSWQSLTVAYNYGGNWTALYFTGDSLPTPPSLKDEGIWRFPQSGGWDGQFYHYMAHDPAIRDGMEQYIDAPRLRYRRILAPAMAFALALGRTDFVDPAYRAVILLWFFLGAYWLSRLAVAHGRSPAWGLAFLSVPAAIVSLDRLAVDVALVALCAAFALYSRDEAHPRALYMTLAAAGLARDTGLLLTAAYCIWLLAGKRYLRAAVFGSAALPTLAWYAYVSGRTAPYSLNGGTPFPFGGALDRIIHPMPYPFGAALTLAIQSLDVLAVAGLLLAFALAIRTARQQIATPVGWCVLLFAALGIFFWRPGDWLAAFDYARILSPLLLFLALGAAKQRSWLLLAPWVMVLPRMGAQFFPQVVGLFTS